MASLKSMLPFKVDIDGPASTQLNEECLFIVDKDGNRIASVNHELDCAVFIASRIAVSMNRFSALVECSDALKRMQAQYGRLHDALSDCIESGRLKAGNVENDYAALVELTVACNGADAQATNALKQLEQLQ